VPILGWYYNLNIGPEQTVGIVGDSGIGKTTILNLIMGMYVLEGGGILIDGQDIAELARGEYVQNLK
jgi:ATP-binding cassette subfamily B protein